MEYEFITYHTEQRITYITLNRPDKRNALNFDVVTELQNAFDKANKDENCKIIVLKANGKAFCAGADLDFLQKLQNFTFEDNYRDSSHLAKLFNQIYDLGKVVIAQIQGPALAGGCGLATICDFSFAAQSAQFGYTEARIGFIPAIVMVFLIRKIGEGKARELLLSADIIDANKAKEYGLINYVVPDHLLENEVKNFALRLCEQNSAQSLNFTKHMIADLQNMSLRDAIEFASKMNAEARANEDCKRGIKAFLNKEKITW
ncbi:MAG: enoyl-CoA hydratase-related protein [Bacteroidia bacterium]|nr:enoyl-CoA hydratase-related protein [Bacteroidia bacterium]MDW8345893.1 enoyl-CoA hydratase-related protein [Bacteroidia bacterium]